jgi:hypothetical protein
VAAGLVVTPWILRNYTVFRQPTISSNFGFALWEGNVPARTMAGGRFYIPADYRRPRIVAKNEHEADAVFRTLAIRVIKQDPARYARLTLGRFISFWDSYPKKPKQPGMKPPRLAGLATEAYVWGFYILSFVGLILLRSMRNFYALLALYLAPTFFTYVLVLSTPRYRYPLDMLLIAAAACTIVLIPRRWRRCEKALE